MNPDAPVTSTLAARALVSGDAESAIGPSACCIRGGRQRERSDLVRHRSHDPPSRVLLVELRPRRVALVELLEHAQRLRTVARWKNRRVVDLGADELGRIT